MPTPGTRLGVYEILALVGEGGMGQVYRARDTRLDRVVAVKVLPEAVAADAERRERFDREARAVAALNHPHICQLHDVGDAGSTRFLVMEYLEGETMQARLLRGPLPIAELVRHAIALADALDHAHRRGLVHRDVKPANIMLTASGVKLLDFGLSRLQPKTDLPALETMTHDRAPLTAGGAVLGTYPYMSPEQLTGKDADARADIFACGAVLYEMATGERAFAGTTAATVIGAILHTDPPPVSTRQALVPAALDRIVARCLAKEPDNRWQTARDLLLELQWLAEKPAGEAERRRTSVGRRVVMSAAIGVAAIALIAAYLMGVPVAAPADQPLITLPLSPPATMAPDLFATNPVVIAPDGRRFVFSAPGPAGQSVLWVRPIDSSDAQPLPGTEGGTMPFWSPDSSSIGFFAMDKLKKVAIAGGAAQTLSDAPQPRGGSWSTGNVILFSAGIGHELYYLSGDGGTPAAIPPDGINLERVQPSFLPGGRQFLYFGRSERHGLFLGSLDSAEATMLVEDSSGGTFVSPGHLLYLKGESPASAEMTLLAQAFDLQTMRPRGPSVPLASGVQFHSLVGLGAFSASNTGALIYRVRPRRTTQLAWFDRDGRLSTLGSPNAMTQPALSPDGRIVAVQRFDPSTQRVDLWSIRVDSGIEERLTTEGTLNGMPVWSPDGNRIAFYSARNSPPNLFEKDLTTGLERRLVESTSVTHATDWTPDGRYVIYAWLNPRQGFDLMKLDMTAPEADRRPQELLATPFAEHFGRVSPDGRWLAYMSEESGAREVYVQRFPELGAKQKISSNGGTEPKWSHDGRMLYYFAPPDVLMARTITPGDTLQPGAPAPVFRMAQPPRNAREVPNEPTYTVAANGRLLINTVTQETSSGAATIVFNWPALFAARNPTAR